MASNKIKAGSKVVMSHSQRQAFMKTSSLGELFGVAHLLPEVENITSKNNALTSPAKFLEVTYKSEEKLQYSMLETFKKSRHKWLSRKAVTYASKSVRWMRLYSKLEKAIPMYTN